MSRFIPAALIAVLAIAVATPVQAGYLIIRVILDSGGSAGGGIVGPGGFDGMRPPGPGSGGGRGGSGDGPPPGTGGYAPPPGDPGTTGSAPTTAVVHDPTRSLVVVVPVEQDLNLPSAFYPKFPANSVTNPGWKPKLRLSYKDQRFVTNVFTDNVSVQLYSELLTIPSKIGTRASEIRGQHLQWSKTKANSKVLFDILTAALQAGLIDDAVTYADELLTFATEKPEGLPAEVAGFAKAYKVMQSGIKTAPGKPNPMVESWRFKLKTQNVVTHPHYSIIYWDASSAEVQRRAVMLEENFKAFFLWHATRGIELTIPDAPMIAVLPKSGIESIKIARALDMPPRMPTDGYYAVEHDLLIVAPERLDQLGMSFARQSQQIYQAGISRDRLLSGDGPKLHSNAENGGKRPEEVARMQTLALVDRLVEDQAALAAISREGSRQLLYATGRLPRYVELPEWLNHGSANFFTRPKDPAFITNAEGKHFVAVSVATGYGGPNYVLQRYFKDLVDKKELNPDRGTLLKNVLTDAYFRGLRDTKDAVDPDPFKPEAKGISVAGGTGATGNPMGGSGRPFTGGTGFPGQTGMGSGAGRPPLGGPSSSGGPAAPGIFEPTDPEEEDPSSLLRKKRDRLSIKAHATAWALCYYLSKERPSEFRKLLDELAAMPRDLPLDGETIVALFCRSMGIENNKAELGRFADGWLDVIKIVPTASIDIPLVDPKISKGGIGTPGGEGPAPPGGIGK